jgi:hypothetical protein
MSDQDRNFTEKLIGFAIIGGIAYVAIGYMSYLYHGPIDGAMIDRKNSKDKSRPLFTD